MILFYLRKQDTARFNGIFFRDGKTGKLLSGKSSAILMISSFPNVVHVLGYLGRWMGKYETRMVVFYYL